MYFLSSKIFLEDNLRPYQDFLMSYDKERGSRRSVHSEAKSLFKTVSAGDRMI